MSETAKLMGLLPLHCGSQLKLTHKVWPPHLVQEAAGEVISIGFHEGERFGMPTRMQPPGLPPAASHPAWRRGWVKLDMIPRWVELRMHGCAVDFTQSGRPGVFFLVPKNGDWDYKFRPPPKVVNHPHTAQPQSVTSAKAIMPLRATQLPLAPAGVGTFQNVQGKTARDELGAGAPIGHTIDLELPCHDDESWSHYFMILGRATSLSTTLLHNFPVDANGNYDWSLFEAGPPPYMCQVFQELERRYRLTRQRIENARLRLDVFPPHSALALPNRTTTTLSEPPAPSTEKKRKADVLLQGLPLRGRLEERALHPPRTRFKAKRSAPTVCANCFQVNCSHIRCCACDRPGCRISLPTCPYNRHGQRLSHADADYGDAVPHLNQQDIHIHNDDVVIGGLRHRRQDASGHGNNCLIFSLATALGCPTNPTTAAQVRQHLMTRYVSGPQRVTDACFLTPEYHWTDIVTFLGRNPTDYTLLVVSHRHHHGAVYGHGPQRLTIENLNNIHFQPLMPQ